jgi:formylglycine-generating enzyme required for sulfatase activity
MPEAAVTENLYLVLADVLQAEIAISSAVVSKCRGKTARSPRAAVIAAASVVAAVGLLGLWSEMASATPPEDNAPAEKSEPSDAGDPQPAPAAKLAPPSSDEQKRLIAEIDEVYKPGDAKGPAAKAALARKLLEDGRKNEANRAEQFTMLRRASEIARDAGEADLMLEAVDALAVAGFQIQPFAVKARLLKQLVGQSTAGGATEVSAVSASCVKFVTRAAADGATNEAAEVLDAAGKSLAKSMMMALSTHRITKAAAARARDPAEKAERQKKADDAEAEVEAIKSAQLAISDCGKALKVALRERELIQAARLRLTTAPDDPQANLDVGSWYCFHQGKWDEGLKLLAKGSDAGLKSLAAEELGAKPASATERVARGDAWWNLAEKATGMAKAAMRQRAGGYYQEALPDLAPSLAKSKAETRLAEIAREPAAVPENRSAGAHPPLAIAPFDEAIAKKRQEQWAKYLRVPVVLNNSIGMKLVLIPPGEYKMGSTKEMIDEYLKMPGLPDWYHEHLPGELPQHKVRITRPFLLGQTAVTQEAYQRVMGVNPSKFQGDAQRPVEQVSWDEAVEFCRRLSELPAEKAARRRYALPTEAQWEYACRAGTTTRWYSGDGQALEEVGWFKQNSGGVSHPVGQKKPNAWGLYDMHGNCWQWCQDFFDVGYYAKSPTDDPTGPASGQMRVYRGGAWVNNALNCRAAYRYRDNPIGRYSDLGLRVSAALPEKAAK